MIRFILVFLLAFSLALLITFYVSSLALPIFQELLSVIVPLAVVTGTLSYALYSYVDGVLKDVSSDAKVKGVEGFGATIQSLTSLKKEILANAFAVIGLLLIERFSHGLSLIFPVSKEEPFNWFWAIAVSMRVACFASSVAVAAVQCRGFIIANDYRAVISRAK
ncbi:hypothetical protein ACH50O_19760 [Methylomonas sp. 2BW1-5-20]|uniref:hypothetical protein n=1 Tax=Methylomonas sp. 2BW1-5-20 TaxID=3376686 RepID=UPI00405247CD